MNENVKQQIITKITILTKIIMKMENITNKNCIIVSELY